MKNYKTYLAIAAITLISLISWSQTQQAEPLVARLLQTYTTTTTRSANIATYCPATITRANLVNSADVSAAQTMRQAVSSQLNIDG